MTTADEAGGAPSPAGLALAEAVRTACLAAAREAYQSASISGLCGEGALEASLGAIEMMDLQRIVRGLESGLPGSG